MTTPQFGPATGEARYSFTVPVINDRTFEYEETQPNHTPRLFRVTTVRLTYSQEYSGVGTADDTSTPWTIGATVKGPMVSSGKTGIRELDHTFYSDPHNDENPYPDWPDWLVSTAGDYHPQKRQH